MTLKTSCALEPYEVGDELLSTNCPCSFRPSAPGIWDDQPCCTASGCEFSYQGCDNLQHYSQSLGLGRKKNQGIPGERPRYRRAPRLEKLGVCDDEPSETDQTRDTGEEQGRITQVFRNCILTLIKPKLRWLFSLSFHMRKPEIRTRRLTLRVMIWREPRISNCPQPRLQP